MFDHTRYNREFLAKPGQNDAAAYGVPIEVVGGALYRCIGVHHLTPEENRGKHHVYLDVLDERGRRDRAARIGWTWKDRRPNEPAPPVFVDKPDTEPGCNIPMSLGQVVTVWVEGETSDRVRNMHTGHPDEGKSGWNTIGHHSFYVVFQRGGVAPSPSPTPDPPPANTEVEALRREIARLLGLLTAIVTMVQDGLDVKIK